MDNTKRKNAKHIPMMSGIGIGIIASIVMSLIGAMICAWMIGAEYTKEGSIPYAALVILSLSSAVGALLAAWLLKEKRLMVCIAVGAGYFLCLIAATALFFGGQYQGFGINALAILIGSAIAVLAGMKDKKGAKHKVKIHAYR